MISVIVEERFDSAVTNKENSILIGLYLTCLYCDDTTICLYRERNKETVSSISLCSHVIGLDPSDAYSGSEVINSHLGCNVVV
jgi:hypothetical protein